MQEKLVYCCTYLEKLSIILVLSWPLSSNSKYKSKNDADEAVSVVSLISSSGVYINGGNSATLGLLIDKTTESDQEIGNPNNVSVWKQ